MESEPFRPARSLAATAFDQIDGLCDRFEAAWQTDQEPRIEDFLAMAAEEQRSNLFESLLLVELWYLRSRRQPIVWERYHSRFPGYAAQIDVVAARSAEGLPVKQFGDYRLMEVLGQGGMGTVYKAMHMRLDRVVAVKVLSPDQMSGPVLLARFQREMKAAGRVSHPNIVQAHDAREIDGTPILVMEYVEGSDLSELAKRRGALSIADACELVRQAAIGLQCVHEHGLVHRDIKPSNLVLSRQGQVKILDLGLARIVQQHAAGDEMTSTGQTMGTADYIAPEQVTDSHNADIRADIYSLGCTLFKLLTGQAPYPSPRYPTAFEKMTAHIQQPPPEVCESCPNMPEELVAVVRRMMAKRPADRFAAPAEVAAALTPFTAGSNLCALLDAASPSGPSQIGPSAVKTAEHLTCPVTDTRSGEKTARGAETDGTARQGRGLARIAGRRRLALAAAGVVLGLVALLGVIWMQSGRSVVPPEQTQDWIDLFDGKTLDGWQAAGEAGVFRVRDGMIEGSGGRAMLYYTGDIAGHDFRDFHLKAEVWTFPKANSGIYFHTRYEELGNNHWPDCGIECQIYNVALRKKEINRLTGSLCGLTHVVQTPARDNQWFTLEIIVEGKHAVTKIDGETVVDYTESEGATGDCRLAHGTFALQCFDKATTVWFKNVRVKDLSDKTASGQSAGTAPKESATWIPLDISRACNGDVINTDSHTPSDKFTFNGGNLAAASWLRKNGHSEPGLPDDGRVPISNSTPQGFFQVSMPPGKNAILMTDSDGSQPRPVTVELAARQFGHYSKVAILFATCWGDGTLHVAMRYGDGSETNATLSAIDMGARQQNRPIPDGICAAVVSRDTHPQFGAPVEFFSGLVEADARGELQSLTFSATFGRPPPKYNVKKFKQYFTVGVFAVALLPVSPSSPPSAIAPFDSAKAKEHQEAWAKHLGVPVEVANSIGMKLVLIPPGEFDMGSTRVQIGWDEETNRNPGKKVERSMGDKLGELALHRVKISRAFYFGECEVTQAEYKAVVGDNPSFPDGKVPPKIKARDTSRYPVVWVSWDNAEKFCQALGAMDGERAAGRTYRLPTEAEWEYACRAGTTTRWSFGDDVAELPEYAWFQKNSDKITHTVGQKRPNPWGLYDIHGNAVEWCRDWFNESYYRDSLTGSALVDPIGPATGLEHVVRGGDRLSPPDMCRSAFRCGRPAEGNGGIGFRVVCEIVRPNQADTSAAENHRAVMNPSQAGEPSIQ